MVVPSDSRVTSQVPFSQSPLLHKVEVNLNGLCILLPVGNPEAASRGLVIDDSSATEEVPLVELFVGDSRNCDDDDDASSTQNVELFCDLNVIF
jgi:hypothetical protein